MIKAKRPGTVSDYGDIGFIEAKDNQGNYQNIDKIYDNQGNIVFQQGYLNEYQGADDFSIPAIGKPLLDYTIYGNTIQSGTPTPDSPIEPEFVGERTENLFDKDSDNIGYYKADTGEHIRDATRRFWMIKVSPGDTIYMNNQGGRGNGVFFDAEKNHISSWLYNRSSVVVPENVVWATNSYTLNTSSTAMVTLNQPIPSEFVPYGYKIPISSAGQTKTIYLGQVPTTRRIKKLVLTGEEGFNKYVFGNQWSWTLSIRAITANFNDYTCLANTYIGIGSNGYDHVGAAPDKSVFTRVTYGDVLYIMDMRFTEVADFKSYLATQYAAGTPVTVWYVLATPEVGIVNEPLAKIGDYADSVDFSQAGIEIPTLKKPNTTVIDVETEVEPSEVDVVYRGATKPKYDLFLAQNGESFEAKDGQSLYIGGDS